MQPNLLLASRIMTFANLWNRPSKNPWPLGKILHFFSKLLYPSRKPSHILPGEKENHRLKSACCSGQIIATSPQKVGQEGNSPLFQGNLG